MNLGLSDMRYRCWRRGDMWLSGRGVYSGYRSDSELCLSMSVSLSHPLRIRFRFAISSLLVLYLDLLCLLSNSIGFVSIHARARLCTHQRKEGRGGHRARTLVGKSTRTNNACARVKAKRMLFTTFIRHRATLGTIMGVPTASNRIRAPQSDP